MSWNPQDTVREFLSCWEKRDVGGVMAFFTPDAVVHIDHAAPARGIEDVRTAVALFMAVVDAVRFECIHVATVDNVVLTERVDHFRIGSREFAVPFMGVFEVRDGKIAAFRDYFDMRTFEREAGLQIAAAGAEAEVGASSDTTLQV